MKIEVTCQFCHSLLRVDEEHAGKQLRCPTCNNLSPIPQNSIDEKFKRPLDDFEEPQPEYINPHPSAKPSQGVEPLIFGILGIVLNIGCGCLFPMWFVLNLFGLYMSIRSDGKYRLAAIITNSIALAIGGFWILTILLS